MTVFAILTSTLLSALPSPAELRADLDAKPWRPTPAVIARDTSTKSGAERKPMATTTAAPAPSPAPVSTPTATPTTGAAGWAIQLGAISNPDAARTEQKRLEKILGGSVDIFLDPPMHKLRWGNFASKEEAEAARANLKAKSVDGFSVHR